MIIAFDVQYDDAQDRACAAAVWFDDWTQPQPSGFRTEIVHGLAPYVPGEFYRRELPCLLPLAQTLLELLTVTLLIVDAHVDLAPGRPGMGRHLHDALEGRVAVAGVAKRSFHEGVGRPVLRGTSRHPLWVTASQDIEVVVAGVAAMAGAHRAPTLFKQVDRLAREGLGAC